VRSADVQLSSGPHFRVTVSMGVGVLGPEPEDMDSFIHRVDTALYNSKSAGKDRITLA
jgi:PleD family two-component response regulator